MDRITQLQDGIEQLLTIMSSSITYLCAKADFKQVSEQIPMTRTRPAEKVDSPDIFAANKQELVADLMRKTRQIQILIQSLPAPEHETEQAERFEQLERDMQDANREYKEAVTRASARVFQSLPYLSPQFLFRKPSRSNHGRVGRNAQRSRDPLTTLTA